MLVEPAVLALSLAIYCTSWTFYGAVGRVVTLVAKRVRPIKLIGWLTAF
jgi:hypothetical protein